MANFQTTALMVPPAGGDNSRINPTQLCGKLGKRALTNQSFSFCTSKPPFDAPSGVYQTDVWSVQYIHDHSHCTG